MMGEAHLVQKVFKHKVVVVIAGGELHILLGEKTLRNLSELSKIA